MWLYDQSSGKLLDPEGGECSSGYSGHGAGKNNPAMQSVRAVGPIPRGSWKMVRVWNSPNTGPYTIVLEPFDKNKSFGRSEFRIHGDSKKNPGNASRGCIILTRAIREKMFKSGDMIVKVIE